MVTGCMSLVSSRFASLALYFTSLQAVWILVLRK